MDLQSTFFFALAFAVAACCGAFLRYALTQGVERFCGKKLFPWGLFAVNTLGCLGFGIITGISQNISPTFLVLPESMETIILSAFLGSFTTFSSFIFEADIFLKNKKYLQLTLHISGQICIGFGAFFLGKHIFSHF